MNAAVQKNVGRDSSRQVNDINVVVQANVGRDSSRQNQLRDINVAVQAVQTGQNRNYIVTEILRKLKGSTSRECNKILNRRGEFWQHESYDHVVRNIDELKRIVNYVLQNPLKAGLVDNWTEWRWSYYNPKYLV